MSIIQPAQPAVVVPLGVPTAPTAGADRARASDSAQSPHVPILLPEMSIAILVVGTHGDVLPFISLAKALQAKGHRVRIATHAQHRRLVRGYSVEHFTIGGNPVEMSKWMVESGGTLVGEARHFKPAKLRMINAMIRSLWPAVTAVDEHDADARPFVADAIIANPPCLGHVHVAEALGVPLHCMFPQPWVATKAFPHPMSGLSQDKPGLHINALSYKLFEEAMWLGNRATINAWRASALQLPAIPLGSNGGDLIKRFRVPFSFMWSPAFVPKPADWGEHIEVVGAFEPPPSGAAAASVAFDPLAPPFARLSAWLASARGRDVIFVGFGSMVIADVTALSRTIVDAAKATGMRVLVQSNWAKLQTHEHSAGLCFDIGPCPHEWLLPQVTAVVHHGGAGTTAAGLRAGKPTLVCPFFGDQFFWGEMVRRAGAGPEPCPIAQLSAHTLAAKLRVLADPTTRAAAERLGAAMAAEDGVRCALAHFERELPRQAMLCDASLLLEPPQFRVARFRAADWRGRFGVRLGSEAMAAVRRRGFWAALGSRAERGRLSACWLSPYRPVRWGVSRLPGALSGLVAGLVGMSLEVLLFACDPLRVPDACARRCGALGCVLGLALTPFWMLGRLLHAAVLLLDRVATGGYNGYAIWRAGEGAQPALRDYVLDPSFSIEARRALSRIKLEAVALELAEHAAPSAQRAAAVLDAVELAEAAKRVYAPHARRGHVATARDVVALAEAVRSSRNRRRLDLSDEAAAALARDVLGCGAFCSFAMFCLLLQRSRAAAGRSPTAATARPRWRADVLRTDEGEGGGASAVVVEIGEAARDGAAAGANNNAYFVTAPAAGAGAR